MKTITVAVLALVSASVLARPIVVPKGTTFNPRNIAPREFTDLEARRVHINWHKVGDFFKRIADVGKNILFRRNDDGDLILVARDTIDDGELVARGFDDIYLEAREFDDDLKARDIEEHFPLLEARRRRKGTPTPSHPEGPSRIPPGTHILAQNIAHGLASGAVTALSDKYGNQGDQHGGLNGLE